MKIAIVINHEEEAGILKREDVGECLLFEPSKRYKLINAKLFRSKNILPEGDETIRQLYNILCSIGAEDTYQLIVLEDNQWAN